MVKRSWRCCAGARACRTGRLPVAGFVAGRYLGRWYEIARLDHSFERGLANVTADYSTLRDGHIEVINRGFDPARGTGGLRRTS